ncbi:hypothetical protein HZY86_04120 [Aerococcaceae bacterium DSM 111020]|nr:hypothetical protein [Aerococcaceae bacterium DSM 111020]
MKNEDFQMISHEVELTDERNPMIGEFKIHFLLRVPRSHIATDIRTGFPYLMREDREQLEEMIDQHFIYYINEVVQGEAIRPLTFIDGFLESLEIKILELFATDLKNLYLESTSVSIFTDILSHKISEKYYQ